VNATASYDWNFIFKCWCSKKLVRTFSNLHIVGENSLDLVVSVTGGQHMKTLTQFRTATLIGLLLLTNEAMAQKSIPTTHTIFMTSV